MIKQLMALLKGPSETSDQVASKIADLEQLEQDETQRIASLRTAHGEALIGGNSLTKIEQELEVAGVEHVRITAALEALRVQHTHLSQEELNARAVADLKAAVKAVTTIPKLMAKYTEAAGHACPRQGSRCNDGSASGTPPDLDRCVGVASCPPPSGADPSWSHIKSIH